MSSHVWLDHRGDGKDDRVEKIDKLTKLLITEKKRVLIVGEGDFSFTVALAALRYESESTLNIWEGITATRYEPVIGRSQFVGATEVICKPAPDIRLVMLECAASAADFNFTKLKDKVNELEENVADSDILKHEKKSLLQVVNRCQEKQKVIMYLYKHFRECDWMPLFGIDALAVPKSLTDNCDVIWFQCPWLSAEGKICELVSGFLLNLAGQIKSGVYVCIGITKYKEYVHNYNLEDILGKNLEAKPSATAVLERYQFHGADSCLVEKILSFGYHHRACNKDIDIHEEILRDHVTLVFQCL